MTDASQDTARKPIYKRAWFWVAAVLVVIFGAITAFVMSLVFSISAALDIDTSSQVNRSYTERALIEAFDGQLAGVAFTGYGEMKSAFSSDLSAVALIPAEAMAGLADGPVHAHEVGMAARVAEQYPHLTLSPDAEIAGRAQSYSGRDQLILFRLGDGSGLLQLQSF